MTIQSDDFSENDDVEEAPPPSDEDLATVATLVRRQLALEREVAEAEAALALKKKALFQVCEVDLPAALMQVGLEVTRVDGRDVELKTEQYASIPEAQRPAAFAYLTQHGHASLIKRSLVLELGKDAGAAATKILDFVRKLPGADSYKIADREGVHPQTLNAFVRQQARSNVELPAEVFGIFVRRYAKIKTKKASEEM